MVSASDKQYLRMHRQLRGFWEHDEGMFGNLSPAEQWLLHDYFQPSKKLTAKDLLAHRATIAAERPALPEQAMAAAERFNEQTTGDLIHRAHLRAQPKPVGKKRRTKASECVISVRGVVRPEIDTQRLARALIAMAVEQAKTETSPPAPDQID